MKRTKLFTTLCLTAIVCGGSFVGCASREKKQKSWHDMPLGFVAPPARATDDFVSAKKKDQKSAATDEALAKRPVLRTLRTMSEALKPTARVVKAGDPTKMDGRTTVDDPNLYILAGRMSGARGQYETAGAHFQHALEIDKTNLKAIIGYGQVLTEQGKYDDAIAVYRKGIDDGVGDLTLASEIGYCLLMSGETERSIKVLQALVAQDPASESYRKQLAYAFVSNRQENAAFEQLATIMSESAAWKEIGAIQTDLGDSVGASDALKLAASLNGDPRARVSQRPPTSNSLSEAMSRQAEAASVASAPIVPAEQVIKSPASFSALTESPASVINSPEVANLQFKQHPTVNTVSNVGDFVPATKSFAPQIRTSRTLRVGEFSEFAANSASGLVIERENGEQSTVTDFVSQMNAASFNDDGAQMSSNAVAQSRANPSRLSQEAFERLAAEKTAAMQARIQLINDRVAQAEKQKKRPFAGAFTAPPRASLDVSGEGKQLEEAKPKKSMSTALRSVLFR